MTRIARSVAEAQGFAPSAVAIGNFDGVHAGHKELLRTTVAIAKELGAVPTVLTFDPHPACVVAPDRAPRLINTIDQRCALLEQNGMVQIAILPFTAEFAKWTPEEFVSRLLVDALHAKAVVIGDNFRFGFQKAGSAVTLEELGRRFGYVTRTVPAVERRGAIASASEVRKAIEAGEVGRAGRILERPFALEGNVIAGHGIGSKQTVPTLNLDTAAQVLPRTGVYITRTLEPGSGRRWNSITNVGYRPTFGQDPVLSIETFLLDPFDGATPERIRVEFLRRVRDERKFETPDALKAQILRDVGRAKSYFRRVSRWVGRSIGKE